MNQLKNSIIEVLRYFAIFDYPPTAEEIYVFLKKPAYFRHFKRVLEEMKKKGELISHKSNNKLQITNFNSILNFKFQISNSPRYTLEEYGIKKNQISKIKYQKYLKRQANSVNKLINWRIKLYLRFLSLCSQIKLAGLSGSIAMLNAEKEDDIDLFIITAKNRLFTGRLIALSLAQFLGLRRKRESAMNDFSLFEKARYLFSTASPPKRETPRRLSQKGIFASSKDSVMNFFRNKICLNLFFDETDLAVPKFKRTEYVTHELLQMKPMINKSQAYERFLEANLWVTKLFPNTVGLISNIKNQRSKIQIGNKIFNSISYLLSPIFGLLERLLRHFQLRFIEKHRTNEIIAKSQLWFHPEDFGKKMHLTNEN